MDGSTSTCDESSEADLNPCKEEKDIAIPLSNAKSLLSLSKRLDDLLISYESQHKTWPVQQEPVRLPSTVENKKLSVKKRAKVLDQREADTGT